MSEQIKSYIEKLIQLMISPIVSLNGIDVVPENSQFRVILNVSDNTALIEENCELLQSIQHIIRVAVHNKFPDDRTHFVLDVDNYNKKREKIISVNIPNLAHSKVLGEGKTIILINLTGYERLQVHNILLDVKGVETTSVGVGKNRKLLIIPTSDLGATSLEDSIIFDLNSAQ
jgi:predicted RNA-binding protein Jag